MDFNSALKMVLELEGGYVNNPKDPGGATNYGVTQSVAMAHGYSGDMKTIPMAVVEAIYRKSYWDPIRADEIPDQVRYAMFDAAVNSGVVQSVKWLQRVVGVNDDGVIGQKTMDAVKNTDSNRLLRGLISRRLEFLTGLKTWSTFGAGWTRRVCKILNQ